MKNLDTIKGRGRSSAEPRIQAPDAVHTNTRGVSTSNRPGMFKEGHPLYASP